MFSDATTEYAIEVISLSKCYQIYNKPVDRLKQMLMSWRSQYFEEFWAIKDVNFKISKGETIGIIGRNGSGKSTLLQMICGTLNPSAGEIKINGRVAALLELGAGFNPEFTGVENVYMAASLYGLSKEDIDQRLEAISNFADIGAHMQQPVKTYSSGMYVRLAFAVIAHVDADILVIDEALAVGDAVFTQKCMRYIRNFKEKGTLLFVSHDMSSVLNLCERAIWLHDGGVKKSGGAKLVSEEYLHYALQEIYGEEVKLEIINNKNETKNSQIMPLDECSKSGVELENLYQSNYSFIDNLTESNGWKSGAGDIKKVTFSEVGKSDYGVLRGGELVRLEIDAVAHVDMSSPILGFVIRDKLGQDLFGENTWQYTNKFPIKIRAHENLKAEFIFKLPMLQNGVYSVMTSFADGDLYKHIQHHLLHNALVLHVVSERIRYGMVGIEFNKISLIKNDS